MTTAKLLPCPHCKQTRGIKYRVQPGGKPVDFPFNCRADVNMHIRVAHVDKYLASHKKMRDTKATNQRAKAEAAKAREERMRAASEQVIDAAWTPEQLARHKEIGVPVPKQTYELVYTYRADPRTSRRPTPDDLRVIQTREIVLREAQASLERAIAYAWRYGTPVTEAEVAAALAAGEGA